MTIPITNCPLKWTSSNTTLLGASIPNGGVAWAFGAWTQVFTSTPFGFAIAAISIKGSGGFVGLDSAIQVGWGQDTSNICIGASWPMPIGHDGVGSTWSIYLPIPITIVPEANNIYVRWSAERSGGALDSFALGYYEQYDASHLIGKPLYRDPGIDNTRMGDGIILRCPNTPWTFGSWTQISAGPPSDGYFAGISIPEIGIGGNTGAWHNAVEFEIGFGATPTSIGILPAVCFGDGTFKIAFLPRVVPITMGTAVKVRMRTEYTGTSPLPGARVAVIYYANPAIGCEGTTSVTTGVALSGIYYLNTNKTVKNDSYYNDFEKKIPDPTIRTALIGE